ncbi:MAG: polyprenyl synthetase family protein [bacterium]
MFSEKIIQHIQKVNKEIERILLNREPASLYKPMYYLLAAGGKRIRPVLLLLSCGAVGGKIEDCIKAAAAVELLHTFTLVHDDIMDNDDLRRGMKTVHRKWDDSTAILAGDGLVTVAYQTLLKTRSKKIKEITECFTDGLLILCEGQALDKDFEKIDDVNLEQYEDMIERKTAKLIEVSCLIGGIIGNATTSEMQKLQNFSFSFGKAFQIQDDLLDIMSHTDVAGKPVGSDILARKKTYLTIYFLENCNPQEAKEFLSIWRKKQILDPDIQRIKELFIESQTISTAKKEVDRLIQQSVNSLDYLKNSEMKNQLKAVVMKIRERNF